MWCVQVSVLLIYCKQNMTSLSLLAGRTVHQVPVTLLSIHMSNVLSHACQQDKLC